MGNLIYSPKELFNEYLKNKECKYYNIPEYQRGYKWTAKNVKQLLTDLSNFSKVNDTDFYCLQNITLAKSKLGKDEIFNVIDGQQRLTSLFILLSYLQYKNGVKYLPTDSEILKYSVRVNTDKFLQEQVRSGKIWEGDIEPESMETKDQYYIATACRAIMEWYEDRESTLNDDTVLNDLKLIVNEVGNGEEETVFANLNGGKVDLDGADLVRAILITRAAKQKYPQNNDKEKVSNFRIKLGIELDEANIWWSQKEVAGFFEQLLPNKISENKSFKYKEYPIDLLYYAFYEAYKTDLQRNNKNDVLDLRHFENGMDLNGKTGDDYLEFYNTLSEFNATMKDWYEEDEIFNLLGYLMSNFKYKVHFSNIWKIWDNCQSKTEFVKELKKQIRECLTDAFFGETDDDKKESEDEKFNHLLEDIKNPEKDWYENYFTKTLLPLADILPVELKTTNNRFVKKIIRATLSDFKSSDEDKEHVRSQKRDIDENNITEEVRKELEEENLYGLNSLGNIVLLHLSVNRSYGNSNHCLKMDRILNEMILGETHIRPHTFYVFRSKLRDMKNNGKSDNEIFWSDKDIQDTANALSNDIRNYLNTETENE